MHRGAKNTPSGSIIGGVLVLIWPALLADHAHRAIKNIAIGNAGSYQAVAIQACVFNVAMSTTNRYLTSLLSMRS